MESKILKISSLCLALTIAVSAAFMYYTDTYGQEVQNQQQNQQMSGLQMLEYNTEQAEETDEAEFEQQLCIELPEGMGMEEVLIENDYVKQLITVRK